jgi:hypothetical protein
MSAIASSDRRTQGKLVLEVNGSIDDRDGSCPATVGAQRMQMREEDCGCGPREAIGREGQLAMMVVTVG